MQKSYIRADDFVYRKIGNETILVPIKKAIQKLHSIYTLNETACRIWELLKDKKSHEEIASCIFSEYDVKQAQLEEDLKEYLGQLESIGAVTVT